jgi:hypothetical protein
MGAASIKGRRGFATAAPSVFFYAPPFDDPLARWPAGEMTLNSPA